MGDGGNLGASDLQLLDAFDLTGLPILRDPF